MRLLPGRAARPALPACDQGRPACSSDGETCARGKRGEEVNRVMFEQLVADALKGIPRRFRKALDNLAIVVEDEPSLDLLEEMEIEPPDTLLGLYQGTPLTERRWDYGNVLPDRVLIFQGPHEREAEDDEDLVTSIGETLIHEIGHYFGMSEEQIEEIEEKYWGRRGREPFREE